MNTPGYDDHLLRRVEALEAKRPGNLSFGRVLGLLVLAVALVLAADFEPWWQVRRAHLMAQEYCANVMKRGGAHLVDQEQRQCRARMIRSILVGADMR